MEINKLRKEVIDLLEEARTEYNIGKKFQYETMLKFNHAMALADQARTTIAAKLFDSDNTNSEKIDDFDAIFCASEDQRRKLENAESINKANNGGETNESRRNKERT